MSPEGRITDQDLGLYSDENEDAMARVVAFVRKVDAQQDRRATRACGAQRLDRAAVEGGGAGKRRARLSNRLAVGGAVLATGQRPKRSIADGLQKVRNDFVVAAERAQRLDVDVIELHFAHGYLAHEFLSPLSNRAHRCSTVGRSKTGCAFRSSCSTRRAASWPTGETAGRAHLRERLGAGRMGCRADRSSSCERCKSVAATSLTSRAADSRPISRSRLAQATKCRSPKRSRRRRA